MTLDDVIQKLRQYSPDADPRLLRRAYDFAAGAHNGQTRLTGEAYIRHPLEVAGILTDIEGDPPSVAAGLLHDVVEENEDVHVATVKAEFGDIIGDLVDGVTKLTRIHFRSQQDEQAENLRKVFLAMAKDIRVIVIKLADRLHNMRTLHGFDDDPDKQKSIAAETLRIFAPLSHRLGVWRIKWELEDRAFRYLEPEAYADIVRRVSKTREQREGEIQEAIAAIRGRLSEAGISAEVTGRPKHLYSIYQKMLREGVDFDQIYDLTAIRIIVNTIGDCYAALGLVHDLWLPIPDMFTDYIAKPKANDYQSLHTKVVGPRNQRMEVQIRTWDMHWRSEYGVAAHWRYKEGGRVDAEFDERLSWLRRLLDLETEVKESNAFLTSLQTELFRDEVFVFT
ncbi:MAG: RelA/SpoT family protein, partial [Armatimonadota bacterium]